MKNTVKLIVIMGGILISQRSMAQFKKPGITLGVSAFYASPQGDLKNHYKGGAGGEVKGGIGLGKTYVIGTLGYGAFATRSGNNGGTLTVKPMMLGLKRYFLLKRMFINGDVGVALLKDNNISESRFSADIGGGVRLAGMEASIYYDTWKNVAESASNFSNTIQFKVGYNFTF